MNLEILTLSKSYKKVNILKEIDLKIGAGSIVYILGQNGVGKSTLLNILGNLIKPNNGKILYNGLACEGIDEASIKKEIGLLSNHSQLIEELNPMDYLYFVGLLYGQPKSELKDRIEFLLNLFFEDVKEVRNKSIQNFSSGMKRKVELCATFIHDPTLVLLDEPFNALDYVASEKLVSLILENAKSQKTTIMATHNLNLLKEVATHIVIISDKKIAYKGSINDFLGSDYYEKYNSILINS